jgi:hypothetical protein
MDSRVRGNDDFNYCALPLPRHPREPDHVSGGDPCRKEAVGGAEGVKAGSERWIPACAGMTTLDISSCLPTVIPVQTGIHAGRKLRVVLSE